VVTFAVVIVAAAGCGDDANDGALQAERAAELAAEFRAAQTTVPGATVPDATMAPAVEPTGVVVPVVALDNSFRPQSIEIHVGDEVVWENRGANEHNVLSIESDTWGVEVADFQPGAVYAHVFTEPGEYQYFCSIHGNEQVGMVGTIIVSA
jgi:plastocyanin